MSEPREPISGYSAVSILRRRSKRGRIFHPGRATLQSLRTFPELGTIFQLQHVANSIYHSLQIKAEKRFTAVVVPGQLRLGEIDRRRGHAGVGSFEVWRRTSGTCDWSAGFPSSTCGAVERRLRLLFSVRACIAAGLENWQLSGNLTFQDGTPLNPVYFATDIANSGTPNRPMSFRAVHRLPSGQRNADHFFNTNAFSTPAPYTFGDAGRDIIPGPATRWWMSRFIGGSL